MLQRSGFRLRVTGIRPLDGAVPILLGSDTNNLRSDCVDSTRQRERSEDDGRLAPFKKARYVLE